MRAKTLLDYIGIDKIDPLQMIRRLVELGLTDIEIASALGLTRDQFFWMLKNNPDVHDMIAAARERPNSAVESALFKRACGFKTREVVLANGRPTKVILNEFPPDVTACIFWLKNRDAARWKDAYDVNLSLRDQIARAQPPERKALPDPNVVDVESD